MLRKNSRLARKGQAMVEYALLVVCIAVVAAVAASVLGHKTADTLAVTATIMPGAHAEDNAPISTSELIPTTTDGDGNVVLNAGALVAPGGVDRYAPVFGAGGSENLVGGD